VISAPELSKHLTTSHRLYFAPLIRASKYGHIDVVKCLLSSGADINLRDEGGQSPLFVASEEGHCDGLKCLLSFGADINLCDEGFHHAN
jgi:ankyrin repeat protein